MRVTSTRSPASRPHDRICRRRAGWLRKRWPRYTTVTNLQTAAVVFDSEVSASSFNQVSSPDRIERSTVARDERRCKHRKWPYGWWWWWWLWWDLLLIVVEAPSRYDKISGSGRERSFLIRDKEELFSLANNWFMLVILELLQNWTHYSKIHILQKTW